MVLSRPNCRLAVQLPTQRYALGAQIDASVSIDARETFRVREASIELTCVGHYTGGPGGVTTGSGGEMAWGPRAGPAVHTHYRQQATLLREADVLPGYQETFRSSFTIPLDAPPTYRGSSIYTIWSLKAELDVLRGRNVVDEVLIDVLRNVPTGEGLDGLSASQTGDDCGVVFELDSDWMTEGDDIRGSLLVTPRKTVDVTTTRVELHRIEVVSTRLGAALDTTPGATMELGRRARMFAGVEQSMWFQLPVGERERPFLSTEGGRAYGELRGIVALAGSRRCMATRPVFFLSR